MDGLAALSDIPLPRLSLSRSCPSLGFFGSSCSMETGLKIVQESTKLDKVGNSIVVI